MRALRRRGGYNMAMREVVIASGNAGKVREIRAALAPLWTRLPSLSDLGIAQAAEPHRTFWENALAKARAASAAAKCAAVSDDSGLVVPSLGGAPGVHSARYAGADADDAANNKKLLAAMRGLEDRRAFYYAAIVFLESPDDPAPVFAEGFWRGEILNETRGENGFGYDPLFYDSHAGKTGAQMSAAEKNQASHRGKSLRALMQVLAQREKE